MKITITAVLASVLVTLASCGSKEAKKESQYEFIEGYENMATVNKMIERSFSGSTTVNGKKYTYSIEVRNADSLEHVFNSEGMEYIDNTARLIIRQDSATVLNHVFTKQSFASIVPKALYDKTGMSSLCYNKLKEDKTDAMYFIASVGDPDETADMFFPIEITVAADGTFTMAEATGLDTEPIQ